jgi:hypothetical protein
LSSHLRIFLLCGRLASDFSTPRMFHRVGRPNIIKQKSSSKLWHLIMYFFHPTVTSSFLNSNILLNILCSNNKSSSVCKFNCQ